MNRLVMLLALGSFAMSLSPMTVIGQDVRASSPEEQVRKAGAAYIKAFNDRDARALAEQWSPEAVYENRLTGNRVEGRAAIAQQFEELFATATQLKLAVQIESIQFVSPNVASEVGIATFVRPEQPPAQIAYSAVYVQRDGKWLLDRVTDRESVNNPSNYDHLRQLEWMVGSWVDEDDATSIVTECKWAKNNSFLVRSFTVSTENRVDLSGMQIIGWDADAKQIRSWTFDSVGGFSEGQWTRKNDRWYVAKSGVLADGGKVSAINIITYVDDNSFKLQSTQRTVAGRLLPNIDEVLVVRQ